MKQQNKAYLTFGEAAKMYGVARTTIYRAAENGLSVQTEQRGNKSVKVVEMAELIRFFNKEPVNPPETTGENTTLQTATDESNIELLSELAELREAKKQQAQRIADLERARDKAEEQAEHWRKQADNQVLLLTDERNRAAAAAQQAEATKAELDQLKNKKSFWQRLTGR